MELVLGVIAGRPWGADIYKSCTFMSNQQKKLFLNILFHCELNLKMWA